VRKLEYDVMKDEGKNTFEEGRRKNSMRGRRNIIEGGIL